MNIIQENVSLKDYTSYKTGGLAKYFSKPASTSELIWLIDYAKSNNINYEIIGGGTNLLVSDNGYNGLIICTADLNRYIIKNGNTLICGAGISLAELVLYAVNNGLEGMENMAGIPGTVGGAVKMNAGAYGTEIVNVIDTMMICDRSGNIKELSNNEAGFGYRQSKGIGNGIVLEGVFQLRYGKKDELFEKRKEILEKRRMKQPLHKPSCGSVFKRPEGNYAGTLIESCGLKGYRVGGAVISEKHANFILNEENATSADIKEIIDYVIENVREKTGITLEPEVRMIGF